MRSHPMRGLFLYVIKGLLPRVIFSTYAPTGSFCLGCCYHVCPSSSQKATCFFIRVVLAAALRTSHCFCTGATFSAAVMRSFWLVLIVPIPLFRVDPDECCWV